MGDEPWLWRDPQHHTALHQAALVFDLDGVVVDVRATYRAAYRMGIRWHCRRDLGFELPADPLFPIRAVHLLKRHSGFNAPADVVAILLRLSLLRLRLGHPGRWVADWITAALAAGDLADWRQTSMSIADRATLDWLAHLEQPALALQWAREAYVGADAMQQVFGVAPRGRAAGLAQRDRLLLDPSRLQPPRPVAIYTGRTRAEAQWLGRRFALFRDLCHDAHEPRLEAVDTGAHKPDGAPLVRLARRLGADTVLYIGDLAADRDALLHARQINPGRQWLLGQITARRQTLWPQASVASNDINALLDALA